MNPRGSVQKMRDGGFHYHLNTIVKYTGFREQTYGMAYAFASARIVARGSHSAGRYAKTKGLTAPNCFEKSLKGPSFAARQQKKVHFSQTMSVHTSANSKEVVSTDLAPAALGPYSQAIKAGGILYVSGCLGIYADTMTFAGESVEEQTDQLMKNMGEVLKAAGADYSNIVKTTVLLADIGDFKAMNGIYAKYFEADPPARSCFAVKDLPLGAKVEVECIAQL